MNIELFKYLNNWLQDCTKHIFITITDSFSSHVIYVFYALLLLVLISKSPNSFEFIYFSLCVNRFINLCSVFCPVWFTVLKCEYDAVIHVGCTLFSSFWLNSTQSETICCAVTYEWTSGKIQPTETNYFSSCHTSATAFI